MGLNVESLSNQAKTVLLTRLANVLTICARDTYEVGTERVLQPEVLRSYNELLHRVIGAARDHLSGSAGYSLQDILDNDASVRREEWTGWTNEMGFGTATKSLVDA